MNREIIYKLESLYRSDLNIYGYRFGEGDKAVCIMGSIFGTEVQQTHICARLVARLKELEAAGNLAGDQEILIIPAVNPYSLNIQKRFWPMDNTSLDRMFPGYDEGETTQRIAAGLFEAVKGFAYGIQFASFAGQGVFLPHVRILDTGNQSPYTAKHFGLPYVVIRKAQPYETTSLNYNWQIWNTKAFLVYANAALTLDAAAEEEADQVVESVLRFLLHKGIIKGTAAPAGRVRIYRQERLIPVKCSVGGLYKPLKYPGDKVTAGDILGLVLDPYELAVKERLTASGEGTVFFAHTDPLANGSTVAFHILPE